MTANRRQAEGGPVNDASLGIAPEDGQRGDPEAMDLLAELAENHTLDRTGYEKLIAARSNALATEAARLAVTERQMAYGNKVFVRGLIEFTNHCVNDCLYCGIRRSNKECSRYRLTREQILDCCDAGYELGFRTFVLQGGEDPALTDDRMCDLIASIKSAHPDCAVTLSIGERSAESYRALHDAGADRYLLRHETADPGHYRRLHPASMSLERRIGCLLALREAGFVIGAGFMVGSPFQTPATLAEDMTFLNGLRPEMVGIGPFIPHGKTPFASEPAGSVELTCYLLSLIRLTLPDALLPATTALGTMDPFGREKGILSGANVVMPNLSPMNVRAKYEIYENKLGSGAESAQAISELRKRMERIGYEVVVDRGDPRQPSGRSGGIG